jgi:acyl-CoA thioester hydrolase
MQPFHSSVFRVRQYECDAYGHLNNINYVRYLQEVMIEANAAAGYAPAGWLAQMRRLDIEYIRPVRHGDTVALQVSPPEVWGGRVRRSCVYRLAGSGDLVAQAAVETEGADAVSGERAAAPGAQLESVTSPPPLAPLPAPPPGVFGLRRCVGWGDLDMTRCVSAATLLEYVAACGFGVIAAFGWPAARMADRGFAIILRRHQIESLAPAALDDELEIATWASGMKRATATRHYTIRRVSDGALLARVDTLGVWVDLSSGRPIRIPADFLADFAANLAP